MLTAQKLLISVAPNITQSIKCVKAADRHVSEANRVCFHMIFKEKNLKEKIISIRCSLSKELVRKYMTRVPMNIYCMGYVSFYRVFTSNFNIDKQARAQLFIDPIKVASQHAK